MVYIVGNAGLEMNNSALEWHRGLSVELMSNEDIFSLFADMNACFEAFDRDRDGFLKKEEFTCICKALFRNEEGTTYDIEENQLNVIFNTFDRNQDNLIDIDEFVFCWNKWIKVIVRPISALLIVDVQNDFITGSLNISNCAAQHNGIEVIEPINRLLDTVPFDAVLYSLDWHPCDHVSFYENIHLREFHHSSPVTKENAKVYDTVIFDGCPPMKQKLWPRHCVQNTWGAHIHDDLKIVDNAINVYKGTSSDVDSYSVFWDNMRLMQTTLLTSLQEKKITDVYICGLAYDICVGATVADASAAGYRTILLDDCCRGVDADDIEKTKHSIVKNHGIVINSNRVCALVEGRNRPLELGYKLALELNNLRET